MKKRKKSRFSIKPIICLFLLAVCIIITSAVTAHAAGKKTVRVTTQDELIAAINNSEVGTIIFRSETHDSVTIPSNKNAKSKKLEIYAYNSSVTNKAKYKYITIKSVMSYKEEVSGNTIEIPTYYLSQLELAKKKSIKKLVLTGFNGFEATDMYSVIRKGAKIKNIVYKNYNGTAKLDKSSRTLTFEADAFEWGEPTVVVMTFDKSGRMIGRTEDYESEYEHDAGYTYKYDKNGNLLEATGYAEYEEGVTEVEARICTYDKKNRLTSSYTRGRYSAICSCVSYYYDSKGRLIRVASEGQTIDGDKFEDSNYNSIVEYAYDKKGRTVKRTVENAEYSETDEYEYNELGYLVTEKETNSNYPGKYALTTNTYDERGDQVKSVYMDRDGEISTSETVYDENGEWIESVWTYPDGEQYVYKPGMAG
ncbi:MAG: hypothetical protein K6E47_02555 [Lachnospiraceae bacterium]|nr:hypothetical protein [Lachnospiraceae bacterium]